MLVCCASFLLPDPHALQWDKICQSAAPSLREWGAPSVYLRPPINHAMPHGIDYSFLFKALMSEAKVTQ